MADIVAFPIPTVVVNPQDILDAAATAQAAVAKAVLPVGIEAMWRPSDTLPVGWYDTMDRQTIGTTERSIIRNMPPSVLFKAGDEGLCFDVSDRSTLFQDNLGATPVTAYGQSVGRVLDKSGRGNHATQAVFAARPIYARMPKGGRRNRLPNNSNVGVALGVIGAGGALPDGWSLPTSLTREIIGFGTVAGLPYLDIRLTGSYTGSVFLTPVNTTAIPAADNQQWASTVSLQIIGAATGVSGVSMSVAGRGVGGSAKVDAVSESLGLPTSLTRSTATGTIRDTDAPVGPTAHVLTYLRLTCTGTVDTTIRVAGAQLERGAVETGFQVAKTNGFDVTEVPFADCDYLYNDQIDDNLPVILPDLGTNATVAYATEAGVTILTGQTIGAGAYEALKGRNNFGLFVINRALSVAETAHLTAYLNTRSAT